MALSSTEAECITLTEARQKAIWLRHLLEDFGHIQENPTMINEDDQSCIKLTTNHKFNYNY